MPKGYWTQSQLQIIQYRFSSPLCVIMEGFHSHNAVMISRIFSGLLRLCREAKVANAAAIIQWGNILKYDYIHCVIKHFIHNANSYMMHDYTILPVLKCDWFLCWVFLQSKKKRKTHTEHKLFSYNNHCKKQKKWHIRKNCIEELLFGWFLSSVFQLHIYCTYLLKVQTRRYMSSNKCHHLFLLSKNIFFLNKSQLKSFINYSIAKY